MNFDGIRTEYKGGALNEGRLSEGPFSLFKEWLSEAVKLDSKYGNVMHLATTDERGVPHSRVVLVKQIWDDGFVFFTNYDSPKLEQLEHTKIVSASFHWTSMDRQVRVHGTWEKTSREVSEKYFNSRPYESQVSAVISPQGQVITDYEEMRQRWEDMIQNQRDVACPENWGGVLIRPTEWEFWQGRPGRFHDRIQCTQVKGDWSYKRLAP